MGRQLGRGRFGARSPVRETEAERRRTKARELRDGNDVPGRSFVSSAARRDEELCNRGKMPELATRSEAERGIHCR